MQLSSGLLYRKLQTTSYRQLDRYGRINFWLYPVYRFTALQDHLKLGVPVVVICSVLCIFSFALVAVDLGAVDDVQQYPALHINNNP